MTSNRAETDADAKDPRLRGRSYAVPFARVWAELISLADSRRGWRVTHADSNEGLIRAEATTSLFRFTDDVSIILTLTGLGLTRVDLVSRSRVGRGDFGANARRIHRFLRALDRRLGG